MTLAQKHNQQQILQENEQFALAWLKATFELSANLLCRIEEQELYRMYIGASSKVGRKGVLSPIHFPRCVRSVFGGTIGPNPSKEDDKVFYYTGIKMRINAVERPQNVIIASTEAAVNSHMKQEVVLQPRNSPIPDRVEVKPADLLINGKPVVSIANASVRKIFITFKKTLIIFFIFRAHHYYSKCCLQIPAKNRTLSQLRVQFSSNSPQIKEQM